MFFADVITSGLHAAGIDTVTTEHRNKEVILLRFDGGRADLVTLVKGCGGCWSQAHRCWYLPSASLNSNSLRTKFAYPLAAHLQTEVHRYREVLEAKAYSKATIRNYTACLLHFLYHFRNAAQIKDVPGPQIRAYQSGLSSKGGLAQSTVNMHINAINFFYESVCGRGREYLSACSPNKPMQSRTLFSKQEVHRIITAIVNLKHRAMVIITCAAGLRISEVVGLRIKDIDSEQMVLHVRQGKGRKDREAIVTRPLLEILRIFSIKYKPKYFLFEGQEGGPYSTRRMQQIMHDAKVRSGVKRQGNMQAIRHSFVAHLMQDVTVLLNNY